MKLLDLLLHSQRWDLSKEMISLTQPSPLLRWFQDDGRSSWRPNTTKFITNTILRSYRWASTPPLNTDTAAKWTVDNVKRYFVAELFSLRQLAESNEETIRRCRGAEFSTVPGPLPLFFETAWQNGLTLWSQVWSPVLSVKLDYTGSGFGEQSTWLHRQIIFTSSLQDDICSSSPRLRKSSKKYK